jgi:hypothetical protein
MRQHGQQPTKHRMPAIAHAKQPGCVTLHRARGREHGGGRTERGVTMELTLKPESAHTAVRRRSKVLKKVSNDLRRGLSPDPPAPRVRASALPHSHVGCDGGAAEGAGHGARHLAVRARRHSLLHDNDTRRARHIRLLLRVTCSRRIRLLGVRLLRVRLRYHDGGCSHRRCRQGARGEGEWGKRGSEEALRSTSLGGSVAAVRHSSANGSRRRL